MSASAQPLSETKLHDFVMKAVGEMGAAMNAALIVVGDKLGLYKAMAGSGPMTSEEVAKKTGTLERWNATSASGCRHRRRAGSSNTIRLLSASPFLRNKRSR